MPFESARIEFESKAQGNFKKVPENWTDARDTIVKYYRGQEDATCHYMSSLNSPRANAIKDKYLKDMGDIMDQMILDNEIDTLELENYNRKQRNKTSVLKWRLERRWITRRLSPVKKLFTNNGIKLNLWKSVSTYLSNSKRIPISQIRTSMRNLFAYANSPLLKRQLAGADNQQLIYTIFELYCSGNLSAARRETKVFKKRLDDVKKTEKIRTETGLTRLNAKQIAGILDALVKTGTNKDKVVDVFIKKIKKLKELNLENFNSVMNSLSSDDLMAFLITTIVSLNEGKTRSSVDNVRINFMVEAQLAKDKAKTLATRKKYEGIFKDTVETFNKYRKDHPEVTLDTTTTAYEKVILDADYKIALADRDLVLIDGKRDLCRLYLGKKNRKEANITKILQADDYRKYRDAAVVCGYSSPPFIALVQALELKAETYSKDLDVKKWLARNEEIAGIPIQDLQNLFFKTGDLSENAITAFEAKYLPQTQGLIRLVDNNDEGERRSNKDFDGLSRKHDKIDDVPVKDKTTAQTQSIGYLHLLKNLHSSCITIISNLESLLVLRKKSNARTKSEYTEEFIQKELKRFKQKAKQYAKRANIVSKFLNIPPELDPEKIAKLSVSPLYGPLIRKRLSPFFKQFNLDGERIKVASKDIKEASKTAVVMNAALPNLVSMKNLIGFVVTLRKTMVTARTRAIQAVSRLSALKQTPDLPPNTPKVVVKMYQKMLDDMISHIENVLKDKNSPISQAAIDKVQKIIIKNTFRTKEWYEFWAVKKGSKKALPSAVAEAVLKDLGPLKFGERIFSGDAFNSNRGLNKLKISGDGTDYYFA